MYVPEEDIIADRLRVTAPPDKISSTADNPGPQIDIPKGIEPPSCDCDCHGLNILSKLLMKLEEKIGMIKCVHCICWGK